MNLTLVAFHAFALIRKRITLLNLNLLHVAKAIVGRRSQLLETVGDFAVVALHVTEDPEEITALLTLLRAADEAGNLVNGLHLSFVLMERVSSMNVLYRLQEMANLSCLLFLDGNIYCVLARVVILRASQSFLAGFNDLEIFLGHVAFGEFLIFLLSADPRG